MHVAQLELVESARAVGVHEDQRLYATVSWHDATAVHEAPEVGPAETPASPGRSQLEPHSLGASIRTQEESLRRPTLHRLAARA